jgi:Na+/melibiose symporter-like transporter
MRMTVALVPLVFLAVSCGAMLLNPLGRGAHQRILRELGSAT